MMRYDVSVVMTNPTCMRPLVSELNLALTGLVTITIFPKSSLGPFGEFESK